jgi:hypothetical protein
MKKLYRVTLSDFDLGQAIDGLEARARAWEDTAHYLRTGEPPSEFFLAEECNSEEEARKLAKHYRRILDQIQQQMREQE